jgi:hypothetical protein
MDQDIGTLEEDVWVTAALWCRDAAPKSGYLDIVGIIAEVSLEEFPVGNSEVLKICFCLEADRRVRLAKCSVALYIPATGKEGHDEEILFPVVPDIEIDSGAPALRLFRVEPRRLIFTEPGMYIAELRSGSHPVARAFLRVEKLELPSFK